jgi:hypothetical protein
LAQAKNLQAGSGKFEILFRFRAKIKNLVPQHLWGRRRNCYRIAIQGVHRSMQHAAIGRDVRKTDIAEVSAIVVKVMLVLFTFFCIFSCGLKE